MTQSKGSGKGQQAEKKEQLLQMIMKHPNYRDKFNRKGALPRWIARLLEKKEFTSHLGSLTWENGGENGSSVLSAGAP